MAKLFWLSVAFVAYVYVGYPLLLAGWSRLAGRGVRRSLPAETGDYPTVSVVLAARDEASRLPARIRNLLELEYPKPIEIIVVSDGSTDQTISALAPFGDRIRVVDLPRGGKPAALNAG